ATFARGRVAALLVTADPLLTIKRDRIVALAAQFKLPAIYPYREYAETGGLMSYGVSLKKGYHQTRVYTRQELKGVKPADFPAYQSIKCAILINLKTHTTLGVKFSDNVLSLADEVME